VRVLNILDETHPTWSENMRLVINDFILPAIASSEFDCLYFEELFFSILLPSKFHFSAAETSTALQTIF
jgi:hypothetical protein